MSSPLAAHIEGYTQTVLTRRSYSNWPHEAGSCRVNPKTPEDLHQSRTTPRTSQFEPAIALLVGGTLRSKALPISVLIDSNTDTKIMRGYSEFCVLGDAVKSPTHGPIDRRPEISWLFIWFTVGVQKFVFFFLACSKFVHDAGYSKFCILGLVLTSLIPAYCVVCIS